ncbi:MAG: DEAD/DEAH box helicase [Patescibacteria group bacterium]|nr:DEAD/DEAH box helicase [Patescibacteria group bacterium]
MISDKLKLWIAQSESWQTYIDFKLPEDSIAAYDFLKRPEDFYISLFGSLYEVLENPEIEEEKILSVAKGMEIYSLKNKRDSFSGVSQSNNILFSAGLYYLANYSSSASLLANIFTFEDYQEDIEKFLLSFLNRKSLDQNLYRDLLNKFLKTGNQIYFIELLNKITAQKDKYFINDPHLFSLYYLTERILLKFKKSNIWTDLLEQNIDVSFWRGYIEKSISKKFPVWDFFPSQKIALEQGLLKEFKSIALQTPTSSGKTAISELLIYNEWKKNPQCRILYLAPFRALASELKQTFGKNLADLTIFSKTIYGGDIPTLDEKKAIQNVNLLISTPEKFIAIKNIDPDFSRNFSMIICDEGHLLGEQGNRGLNYELLLSQFKKENNKKFVFLSAIVPNIVDINNWLGGNEETVIRSDYRATEIECAFLKESPYSTEKSPRFDLEINPLSEIPKKYILYKFLTEDDLSYKKISPKKKKESVAIDNDLKSKSAIIALKSLNSGSVALFAPTKGPLGISGLVDELISQIDKKPDLFKHLNLKERSDDKSDLKEYFKVIFGEDYLLTKITDYSILFHHGDLPQCVRDVIEDYVREEKIKLVICTNTLAEGINLPIRTIVIHTTRRDNRDDISKINLRDLKNLFGRVGRAGKETKGLVIIPNPKDFSIVEKVIKDQELQKVEGYLYEILKIIHKNIQAKKITLTNEILEVQPEEFKERVDVIDKAIIDLLEENISVESIEEKIENLIKETFAYYQANEEEKKTLNTVIQLRGKKIKQYIENTNYQYIKKSGSNLRLYEELEEKLDLENDIWTNLENASNDEWLDFILEIVFSLSSIKYQLQKFNEKNFNCMIDRKKIFPKYNEYKNILKNIFEDTESKKLVFKNQIVEADPTDNFLNFPENLERILNRALEKRKKYITPIDIKKTIKLWMNGKWFEEISKEVCSDNINASLRLINQFMGYNLQSAITSIIHITELKLKEDKKVISGTILDFPQYLQYGLKNKIVLYLMELGFTDRIGIIALSKELSGLEFSEPQELRNYLNLNNQQVLNSIKDKLPRIVYDGIEKSLNFLEYDFIK